MGVAKPVLLPSIQFSKQGDADAHFQAILNRYEDDEYLDAADEELVYELLQRHHEADVKVGCGVVGIFRARSRRFLPLSLGHGPWAAMVSPGAAISPYSTPMDIGDSFPMVPTSRTRYSTPR